jgi:5-amino-6-(5-phospho-D-ribitylamino)uracil phosphatase
VAPATFYPTFADTSRAGRAQAGRQRWWYKTDGESTHVTALPRLFVSDFDGTLADREARVSAFSRRHLSALLKAGLPFTVASARSVHTLAPLLEGLPIRLPVVEFNGAFITDLKTLQPLVCHALLPQVAEATLRWALESQLAPFVSTYARGQQHVYPPLRLGNAGVAWYDASRRAARDVRLRAASDPFTLLDQAITCLTLIGERSRLVPIAAAIQSRFPGLSHDLLYENPYQRGWYWLTVQSHLASKAHGLIALAEAAGVSLAQTTVFGDEVNDIPMFERAGRGVAVENAIAALKLVAHEVIGPHHQDSVVRYLMDAAI